MRNARWPISATAGALFVLLCLACTDDTIVISVMGPAELSGAELFVDDKQVGTFGAPVGSSIDLAIRVAPGTHAFEIRKEGYETARETLQFQGTEGYLTVRITAQREIRIFRG